MTMGSSKWFFKFDKCTFTKRKENLFCQALVTKVVWTLLCAGIEELLKKGENIDLSMIALSPPYSDSCSPTSVHQQSDTSAPSSPVFDDMNGQFLWKYTDMFCLFVIHLENIIFIMVFCDKSWYGMVLNLFKQYFNSTGILNPWFTARWSFRPKWLSVMILEVKVLA